MRWGALRSVELTDRFYEFRMSARQSIHSPRRALSPADDTRMQALVARFGPTTN